MQPASEVLVLGVLLCARKQPWITVYLELVPGHVSSRSAYCVRQLEARPVDEEEYRAYRAATDLREPYRCWHLRLLHAY